MNDTTLSLPSRLLSRLVQKYHIPYHLFAPPYNAARYVAGRAFALFPFNLPILAL